MKKLTLVMLLIGLVMSLMATNFTMSGDFRTRMSYFKAINADDASNFTDSRAQLSFNAEVEKGLNFIYTLRTGDFVWGNNTFANNVDVKTHHAYVKWLCPLTGMEAKAGYQAWYDHKSLVLDDDVAALIVTNKDLVPGFNFQLGYVNLAESSNGSAVKDNTVYMFNVDQAISEDMGWGFNTLIKSTKDVADNGMMDIWFMPFMTAKLGMLNLDLMGAYNYGSYEKFAAGKDATNGGFAVVCDLNANLETAGNAGLNVLFTSGDDGTDPESMTQFHTISNYYMNGLEYFGTGVHDGVNGGWFDASNNGLGMMSIVGKYSYPMNDRTELKLAAGMLNSVEKNGNGETAMGTEVDLGMNYKFYDAYSIKLVGAYAMPGDFFKVGADSPDAVYELSSVLSLEF